MAAWPSRRVQRLHALFDPAISPRSGRGRHHQRGAAGSIASRNPGRPKREALEWAAYNAAHELAQREREHQEQVRERVKEVIALGPPGGAGPLVRHLQWIAAAERKATAASARALEAQAAADRYDAAVADHGRIDLKFPRPARPGDVPRRRR